MGSEICASCSLGIHPEAMNSAARKPQAMKAPMLGMTMELRNFPNLDTLSFIDTALPPRSLPARPARAVIGGPILLLLFRQIHGFQFMVRQTVDSAL